MRSVGYGGNLWAGSGNGNNTSCAEKYFLTLSGVIQQLPFAMLEWISAALLSAYEEERTVFLFGNGGSAALASHFACDLGKGTAGKKNKRKRFRVIALTDNVPTITAWANDSSYDDIFAEQLSNWVEPGDVAFAISCSGSSRNILKALKVAGARGAFRIGLTGFEGGDMKELCNLCFVVPSDNMQIIEDLHLSVAHSLFSVIRQRIENPLLSKAVAARGTD